MLKKCNPFLYAALIATTLASTSEVAFAATNASTSLERTVIESRSKGGSYAGGRGSSHRGGQYVSPKGKRYKK
jgi:hypothetical protein